MVHGGRSGLPVENRPETVYSLRAEGLSKAAALAQVHQLPGRSLHIPGIGRNIELSEKSIKVTDRRMFTSEGQLRDDFRHLENVTPTPVAAESSNAAQSSNTTQSADAGESTPFTPPATAPARRAEEETPAQSAPEVPALRTAPGYPEAEGQRAPQFMDLVGLLAEPASLYLRQAQAARSGDLRAVSEASQNLELSKMHIDLLVVLREKSATNLAAQELAMIDDVIYRLQMAFSQLQGE